MWSYQFCDLLLLNFMQNGQQTQNILAEHIPRIYFLKMEQVETIVDRLCHQLLAVQVAVVSMTFTDLCSAYSEKISFILVHFLPFEDFDVQTCMIGLFVEHILNLGGMPCLSNIL